MLLPAGPSRLSPFSHLSLLQCQPDLAALAAALPAAPPKQVQQGHATITTSTLSILPPSTQERAQSPLLQSSRELHLLLEPQTAPALPSPFKTFANNLAQQVQWQHPQTPTQLPVSARPVNSPVLHLDKPHTPSSAPRPHSAPNSMTAVDQFCGSPVTANTSYRHDVQVGPSSASDVTSATPGELNAAQRSHATLFLQPTFRCPCPTGYQAPHVMSWGP